MSPDELDNDLAGRIARRYPGIGPAEFERLFVATVEATAPDRLDAWTAFYRNTLARLADGGGEPDGTIAGFAPVYERAVSLALGPDVLELGCCFGFLSLRMAAAGHRVTALDLCPGAAVLLRAVAPRLGLASAVRPGAARTAPVAAALSPPGAGLNAVAGDATAVPLRDRCADTVFAVHLLEHLPPHAGTRVLAETLRLARRRVVVAVPFEDRPNPTWGHVRTFDLDSLAALGAAAGLRHEVHEHHGGWLVLDRE